VKHKLLIAGIVIVVIAAAMLLMTGPVSKPTIRVDVAGETVKPDVQTVQKQASMVSEVTDTLDFCDAWSYSKHDPNVSLTIEKCDSSSRTLVLKAVMRDTKNLTVKDAKAQVASKTELKSMSAGACTSAKEADCTDKSKSAESFTKSSPTYDKGVYVIAEKLTEKDLPKYYEITFDKDDKLDGVEIKFGTATEAIVFNEDGSYIYINSGQLAAKLLKNNGGYSLFSLYGGTDMHGGGGKNVNYLNDGAVRIGETTSGATCNFGNQTTLWADITCTAGSASWRSRYYAGYPIIENNLYSSGGDYLIIVYMSLAGAEQGFLFDSGIIAPHSTVTDTKPFMSLFYGNHRFTALINNVDDKTNFGWSGDPTDMLGLYNGFLTGTNERPVDMYYYFPQNSTSVMTADMVNDRAIFTRLVTGLTVNQGTMIKTTNITMDIEAAAGSNPGCKVDYTSNATVWPNSPMFVDCSALFGPDITIYNKTGSGVTTSNKWISGKNESGGWTWKDAGGSTLTNWNESFADGLGHVGVLFTGNDVSFLITNVSSAPSVNTITWSNPIVSPTSPQNYPNPSHVYLNITWNATGSEPEFAWLTTDFSGTTRTYMMTNESKVWYIDYGGGMAAGTYSYTFHANLTDGTSNSTGAYSYAVNGLPATVGLVINNIPNNSVITWPDFSNATAWTSISGTSVIGYCYQETANVSTTCGGLSTGVYSYNAGDWNNVSALIDGDYNTGSDISSAAYKYFYVNYTKPAIATNAYTRLRLAYTEVNTTLPAACWNAFNNTVALAYRAYFNKMSVFCNDGSAFTDVIELVHSNSTFFEEAIAWNMPVTSSPVTLYRNGTEAPNPDLMYFAGGTSYNYTAVLNNANYTAANVSFTQTVNKAAPMFNLTSTNGWILNNGMPTTVACNANATSTLYNNGTVVTSPYTATYTNGTYRYNCTIADTQNFTSWFTSRDLVVSYFVVGACDGIVSTQVIKFDHYSEINLTATENTIPGVTVSIRVPGSTMPGVTYTANYTVPSTEHILCMYPAWATFDADLFMDYGGTNTSWPQRSYFLTNHTISNATETIYLYALETEKATIVPVTVIGYSGAVMQDAIVVVQRYYPSDNSYKDVAMGRTSATGVANIRLQLYDAWYRFIVEKDGVVLKQFDRMQVSNAIELRLQENVINNYWSVYGKVAGACNYLGATANFTLQCTGADTSGKVQSWNLLAKKMGAVSWESVCDVSGTGSAVTLNCPLGNTTDKQYYYSFRYIASPPFILLSNYINNVVSPFALPLGVSLFVVFVFVLAMALIGIWNPAMSLISGGAGIAFMYWLGLMPPSMLPGVVGAIIFVAILAWRMKT